MTRKTTTITETFKDGELVSRVTETVEETDGEVKHHHYHHGGSGGGYGAQPNWGYGDPYCYGGAGSATSGYVQPCGYAETGGATSHTVCSGAETKAHG